MIIKNVKVYTEEQKFVPGEIVVLGDRITEVRADGEKRQTAAEALETEPSVNGSSEDEEAEEILEQCDDLFYEHQDEINRILEKYAAGIKL